MLKLLAVGLPMLCQPTSPDLIAGWKADDYGKVCFCQENLACDSLLLIADNTVRSGYRNIGSDPDITGLSA
jgi:hypothetical protein